jgi:methanogenic corrinoid protein MtbC1
MVAKFLEAAGWQVVTSLGASAEKAGRAAAARWYAAAGVTMAGAERLTEMAELVAEVRARSLNPAIGVMVGGPAFRVDPSLVAAVGADGTAADAPTAVLMAQKLFDIGHGARLAG